MINNEPYFKGKDVAGCLGYEDTSQSINIHCSNYVKKNYLELSKALVQVSSTETSDTNVYSELKKDYSHGEIVVKNLWIPESDVYNLILGSKKPEAKKFKGWVTEAVRNLHIN